jgi:Na+-translocating ferredoxin:NAD+ oxidoreductase subunit A
MSYVTVILTSVFSANAFLVYGLGICPAFRRERRGAGVQLLALAFVNILASVLFWVLRRFILVPLSLQALDVVVYAVVIAPALKYLARFVASGGSGFMIRVGAAADEAVMSCLVFGIALIVSRADYGFAEIIVASLSACVGYWAAVVLLDSIRERLELSSLPAAFRGAPALLLSAGLIAMAFMGIDNALLHNLAR